MPSHRPRIPESKFCQGIYLRRSLFGLLESKKVDGYSRAILTLVTKPKETSQLTKIIFVHYVLGAIFFILFQ